MLEELLEAGYQILPITPEIALRAGRLVGDHGDPFDRMIAAHALAEDIPVISADPKLDVFGSPYLVSLSSRLERSGVEGSGFRDHATFRETMDILRAETPHWANAGCSFFNGTILLGRFGELANSMNDRLAPLSFPHSRPFRSVGVGGMIVGALDLAYAILAYSPGHPILIPQTIASGILGVNAFSGGIPTAALGVVLHLVIALGAAAVYYLASRKLTFLVRRAVLGGLTYGALVYLFMHTIVLPLSAVPKAHMALIYQVSEFVEHWFCVGLPIALSVRHYSR